MKSSRVERYAKLVPLATTQAITRASSRLTLARQEAMRAAFTDPDAARTRAAKIKDAVIANLGGYLAKFADRCEANGIRVHWAETATDAREITLSIIERTASRGAIVAKGKSMVSEEIHLNSALESAGYRPVETDLGEFVVQLEKDVPSHIVAPIIHRNKRQVAATFHREGLGEYTEDPVALTAQAREHLRERFRQAEVGISGVNFGIVETGHLAIVENEGNNRLSTSAPPVHIALMGIERLIPRLADLPLFLRLLTASATAQAVSVYLNMVSGPRGEGDSDGPREVHLVLVDNGRSAVANGPNREILRCLRCGACLYACPVFRQVGGHGYGTVYSGPFGSVLSPSLEPDEFGDLAFASSLCGRCEEVCPVKIPIPEMLLRLRSDQSSQNAMWQAYVDIATNSELWEAATRNAGLAFLTPFAKPWTASRAAPNRAGRDFRRWWNERP